MQTPQFLIGVSVLCAMLILCGFLGYKQIILSSNVAEKIYSKELIRTINSEREQSGMSLLFLNNDLGVAAVKKAKDMAGRGYFSHNAPDGKTPWTFIGDEGYYFALAGENLAVDFFDTEELTKAWMDSPGHRANILNSEFTETGIGVASGEFEGRSVLFFVQMFGKPQPVASVADDPLREGRVLGASTGVEQIADTSPSVPDTNIASILSNPTSVLKYVYYILTLVVLLGAIIGLVYFNETRQVMTVLSSGFFAMIFIWSMFYIYNFVSFPA